MYVLIEYTSSLFYEDIIVVYVKEYEEIRNIVRTVYLKLNGVDVMCCRSS